VGEETFQAHKIFLMAHSPYFLEMFTCPVAEEAQSGVVHERLFPNPGAFQHILDYCYYGVLDSWPSELMVPTYQLADKYMIEDLRDWVEGRLLEEVSKENVVEMVTLADKLFSAQKLREVGGRGLGGRSVMMVHPALSGLHRYHR